MSARVTIHVLLTERCLQPKLHIFDNECPEVLKPYVKKVYEKFQLVPSLAQAECILKNYLGTQISPCSWASQ